MNMTTFSLHRTKIPLSFTQSHSAALFGKVVGMGFFRYWSFWRRQVFGLFSLEMGWLFPMFSCEKMYSMRSGLQAV